MIERVFALHGIMSGTVRCVNTKRPLTHLLDYTERGLAVKATQPCQTPGCPDPYNTLWRPVVGYEGIYEISSHGDIRRIGRAAASGRGRGGGARIGRILKLQHHNAGYKQIQLWRDGCPETFLVHILVAAAFIGSSPSSRHEVNHKDGVKTNACAANLEYETPSGNQAHAWRTGLRGPQNWSRGEAHYNSKLTEDDVRTIRRRYKPRVYGAPRIAREFGVSNCTIYNILLGKTWNGVQ